MTPAVGLRKDRNSTASALFGVAAIQAVVGFLAWSVYRDSFAWFDWVITSSAAIYIVLGIAASRARLPAALIGAAFYTAFLTIQASHGADLLLSGLIFKIPVVVLLILAVASALRRSSGPPSIPTGERSV